MENYTRAQFIKAYDKVCFVLARAWVCKFGKGRKYVGQDIDPVVSKWFAKPEKKTLAREPTKSGKTWCAIVIEKVGITAGTLRRWADEEIIASEYEQRWSNDAKRFYNVLFVDEKEVARIAKERGLVQDDYPDYTASNVLYRVIGKLVLETGVPRPTLYHWYHGAAYPIRHKMRVVNNRRVVYLDVKQVYAQARDRGYKGEKL